MQGKVSWVWLLQDFLWWRSLQLKDFFALSLVCLCRAAYRRLDSTVWIHRVKVLLWAALE